MKYCHLSAKIVFNNFFKINVDNFYTSDKKKKKPVSRIISGIRRQLLCSIFRLSNVRNSRVLHDYVLVFARNDADVQTN